MQNGKWKMGSEERSGGLSTTLHFPSLVFLVLAAVLALTVMRPLPRLEAADGADNGAPAPQSGQLETSKPLPDLAAEVTHSIVRVDVWRPYKTKDGRTGKENDGCAWSTGTGFVVRCSPVGGTDKTDDFECDVVTNNHVVVLDVQYDWTAAAKLLCLMYGVDITDATIVGRDPLSDLAVIRLHGHAPKERTPRAIMWADPNSVRVGEDVLAVGYARNLRGGPTVTRGIVGALHRTEPTAGSQQALFADLIQSDAQSNHGNSGGPLLNRRGEVLGVNTYVIAPTVDKDSKGGVSVDVAQGIFFARSSRTARPFIEQIIRTGSVARLDLGCTEMTLVEPLVRFLAWPEAVMLRSVPATSLAAKVGLKPGDMIVAVGSAAARPDQVPAPSQETKVASVGELNDALGLRGGDACVWVRLIRPSPR